MKLKIARFMGLVLILAVGFSGCYNDKKELLYPQNIDCNNAALRGPKFTAVQQICQTQCISCHSVGGTSPDLSKDCNIVDKWQSINDRCTTSNTSLRMPQGGQLSATDLEKLRVWVDAGHKFND